MALFKKSKGIKIEFADVNDDGEVTLESIEKKITPKTKIIAVTHLSNVTGAILPIREITSLAHSKGIPVLVDGCQGAPHLKIDMQELDCDFYAISCHKMCTDPQDLEFFMPKKMVGRITTISRWRRNDRRCKKRRYNLWRFTK